jgi:hypothetical protein
MQLVTSSVTGYNKNRVFFLLRLTGLSFPAVGEWQNVHKNSLNLIGKCGLYMLSMTIIMIALSVCL